MVSIISGDKMRLRTIAPLSLIAVILCGAGMLLLPTMRRLNSASALHPSACVSEQPDDVLVSCERRNESGNAVYGPLDAPTFGVFVGCSPDEDFAYDVDSTPEEMSESERKPEVAFLLTDLGGLRDVVLTRSSGSGSLDRKVLKAISSRHYAPTKCGTCRVVAKVSVQLRRPDTGNFPPCTL